MISFKVDDKKYVVKQITIADYYKIKTHLILEDLAEKYEMVHHLTGCPKEDLFKIPYNELVEIFALLEVMIQRSLLEQLGSINKIQFQGVEYGLVDFDQMTIGEFSDLDVLVNDPNADNKLHEVMAILYRPITKKRLFSYDLEDYDFKEYKERCKLFLDMPLKYAKTAISFFLAFELASSGATEIFLKATPKERNRMKKKINKVLAETGTQPSPYLQIVIRLKSKQLLNSVLKKLSTIWLGLMMKIEKMKPVKKVQKI